MNHREANPDGAIDRVLTGLREVEPPQGMQQRVLRAVTEREAARQKSSMQLIFANRYVWMTAAASFVLIGVASFWTSMQGDRRPLVATHSLAHVAPVVAPNTEETRLATARVARPKPLAEPRRPSLEQQAAPNEPATDEDALAVSEMNAPSQPAPPMPLTEQERLLIRILDKRDPVELAMLDPQVRSSEEASSAADFERFFASTTVVDMKSATSDDRPNIGDNNEAHSH